MLHDREIKAVIGPYFTPANGTVYDVDLLFRFNIQSE